MMGGLRTLRIQLKIKESKMLLEKMPRPVKNKADGSSKATDLEIIRNKGPRGG
jgi:hypothetical protein